MNNITITQNQAESIKLLRAQRQFYVVAKRLLSMQVSITVLVPAIAAILVFIWPAAKGPSAVLSLVIVILDATILDRAQKTVRKRAAKAQEEFDCSVLGLPWNDFSVGLKLEPEVIHGASAKYKEPKDQPVKDWYPTCVAQVPQPLARIICQRANFWYDSALRRTLATWVLTLTIVLAVGLALTGVILGLPLDALLLTVGAPLIPILVWGIREFQRQREVADAGDRLKDQAGALWLRALHGKCADSECVSESRMFQTALYERRCSSPVIFNWIYKAMRDPLEQQMNAGAETLVAEALATIAKPTGPPASA
jgi:hypothetical protein